MKMRTVVFGKKIENVYSVDNKLKEIKDENGLVKTVYIGKPELKKETIVKEWGKLCSFSGEPRYNVNNLWLTKPTTFSIYSARASISDHQLNISEDETVFIEEEIFRADLNELHLHTDKVISEKDDVNKEEACDELKSQVAAFNTMMIMSNDRLKAYCDLHKLVYEETDCTELFKLVYPDKEYIIEDGVMKESNLKSLRGGIADSEIVSGLYSRINSIK